MYVKPNQLTPAQQAANQFAPARKRIDYLEALLRTMLDDVRYMHRELDRAEAECSMLRSQTR